MTITFTPSAGSPSTVDVVPGTFRNLGRHDDRGGNVLPIVRAGVNNSGQCMVRLDAGGAGNAKTFAELVALSSQDDDVTNTVKQDTTDISWLATLDVDIGGTGVQTAIIKWQGTKNPA